MFYLSMAVMAIISYAILSKDVRESEISLFIKGPVLVDRLAEAKIIVQRHRFKVLTILGLPALILFVAVFCFVSFVEYKGLFMVFEHALFNYLFLAYLGNTIAVLFLKVISVQVLESGARKAQSKIQQGRKDYDIVDLPEESITPTKVALS